MQAKLFSIAAICVSAIIMLLLMKTSLQLGLWTEFQYTLSDGYPIGKRLFGGIAGVDVDKKDNVIIFHRGTHQWDLDTFDGNNVYLPDRKSPIQDETVITIDPRERRIVHAWGQNLFFMPHGLSLDLSGEYLWLTDVALHQAFKYTKDGSNLIITLGEAFVPGNDEAHFCKPTSVADTGEFVFVADGYCNSRIVMFSSHGKYLGEFGQSTESAYMMNSPTIQPTFNIPHKVTYAKEANMLCVADRENGRIQCFSVEPTHTRTVGNSLDDTNAGLTLNGAIKPKFTIADPQFNGKLFSLDYSPLRGGIIVAVSGQSAGKSPLGFVYNVTTGQLISRFSPPPGKTFGMAHDLAITGTEADSLFVVDVAPVNLWKFTRPMPKHQDSVDIGRNQRDSSDLKEALSITHDNKKHTSYSLIWPVFMFSILATVIFVVSRVKKVNQQGSTGSLASLYSNGYPRSINSLFGGTRIHRRTINERNIFSSMFSRGSLLHWFDRSHSQQNDFNRIPLEESDNSDDDKSDSDVEEFNINQAGPSIKIDV